jgi:hypothetical protein
MGWDAGQLRAEVVTMGSLQIRKTVTPKRIILTLATCVLISAILFYSGGFGVERTANSSPDSEVPSAAGASTKKFTGEVSRGQRYQRPVGDNLEFRLEPTDLGWTIAISTRSNWRTVGRGSENFVQVVTPPYRGINPVNIEGWHFRNSENSGPNAAGSKNVNAPQLVREFDFVLNDSEYEDALVALQKILWPYSYSEQQVQEATAKHDGLSKGNGELRILDLRLNNLVSGRQAGVDSMKFEVELTLPP